MDIDKLISNITPIYTKEMGSINEYNIKASVLIEASNKGDLSIILQNQLKTKIGQFIALENIKDHNDSSIIPISIFEKYWWKPSEIIRKELESINNDKSYVSIFFDKYGILNNTFDKTYNFENGRAIGSEIIYDGFSTPENDWNTCLNIAQFGVRSNNDINNYKKRYGTVYKTNIKAELGKDSLCDTDENISIKRCHSDIKLENDIRYTHKYTEKEWKLYLEKGLSLYLEQLDNIVNGEEDIYFNKNKSVFYQKSKKYVIEIIGTSYFQCEIIDDKKEKYRDPQCEISKIKNMKDCFRKEDLNKIIKDLYMEAISVFDDVKFKY